MWFSLLRPHASDVVPFEWTFVTSYQETGDLVSLPRMESQLQVINFRNDWVQSHDGFHWANEVKIRWSPATISKHGNPADFALSQAEFPHLNASGASSSNAMQAEPSQVPLSSPLSSQLEAGAQSPSNEDYISEEKDFG